MSEFKIHFRQTKILKKNNPTIEEVLAAGGFELLIIVTSSKQGMILTVLSTENRL
jgi:hypothetical protein